MIPGCSVGDFVGAYFNTYYNAKRQFTEAEAEVTAQRENKQNDRPFGFMFSVQSTTKAKFTAVIEKCSKLLQYHPESNLVDDALLMIGKSYYYQNDYQQAERKFKELIEQFSSSDLAYEAKLTLGYCYYMMDDKAKSSGVAKGLLDDATQNGEDDYVTNASVLLAQIEVDNKNNEQAVTYFQIAAEKATTSGQRCAAYLNLAALYSQEGNSQRSLEAFRKAESASNSYETSYRAQMGQARMLSKLGAQEESLNLLRDLLSSSKYREFYGGISLEIGNVFKESKDYPSAIAQYTYVDTSYARTESSANSYFQLGDMYETKLFQLDSAFAAYSKGKAESPQAPITIQLARRSDYLAKYLQHRNDIQKYDSLRALILAPPDTTPEPMTIVRDSTLDSMHSTVDSASIRIPPPPQLTLDSVNALLAYNKTELASLLYSTMDLPDSAAKWYRRLLDDHPTSPFVPRALFTLAHVYSQDTTRPRGTADSLYRQIVSRFPESEFVPEAERLLGLPVKQKSTDPAEVAYASAERLLDTGNPNAARDTLRGIVRAYPSSPIASKAQYAIGWIYERENSQPDSAIASYRELVALYPGSQYAAQVRPRLDAYDLTKKPSVPAMGDSTASKDSTSTLLNESPSKKNGPSSGKKDKPRESDKKEEPSSPLEKPKE